jgi:hypothetical protein
MPGIGRHLGGDNHRSIITSFYSVSMLCRAGYSQYPGGYQSVVHWAGQPMTIRLARPGLTTRVTWPRQWTDTASAEPPGPTSTTGGARTKTLSGHSKPVSTINCLIKPPWQCSPIQSISHPGPDFVFQRPGCNNKCGFLRKASKSL